MSFKDGGCRSLLFRSEPFHQGRIAIEVHAVDVADIAAEKIATLGIDDSARQKRQPLGQGRKDMKAHLAFGVWPCIATDA